MATSHHTHRIKTLSWLTRTGAGGEDQVVNGQVSQVTAANEALELQQVLPLLAVDGHRGVAPLILLVARQRPQGHWCVAGQHHHGDRQRADPSAQHVVPECQAATGGGGEGLTLQYGSVARHLWATCLDEQIVACPRAQSAIDVGQFESDTYQNLSFLSATKIMHGLLFVKTRV